MRKKHPNLKVNPAPRSDNPKYRQSVEDALHTLDPDIVSLAFDAVKNKEFIKHSQPKQQPSTMSPHHEFVSESDTAGEGKVHNFKGS